MCALLYRNIYFWWVGRERKKLNWCCMSHISPLFLIRYKRDK